MRLIQHACGNKPRRKTVIILRPLTYMSASKSRGYWEKKKSSSKIGRRKKTQTHRGPFFISSQFPVSPPERERAILFFFLLPCLYETSPFQTRYSIGDRTRFLCAPSAATATNAKCFRFYRVSIPDAHGWREQ